MISLKAVFRIRTGLNADPYPGSQIYADKDPEHWTRGSSWKNKKGYLRNSDVEDPLLPHPEYGRRVTDGPVDLWVEDGGVALVLRGVRDARVPHDGVEKVAGEPHALQPGLAIKNPPKKQPTQKNHLKNPLKMGVFGFFLNFL